jgi:putative transposase
MEQLKQQPAQVFYHTLNRGVEKRDLFLDKQDHLRFIHDLYELNNEDRVETTFSIFKKDPGLANVADRKQRKLLVDILAFCLMPNHYHLLLSPRVKNGISKFMAKINIGYAKYFNQKYERTGALFQGRYKKVLISENTHFLHLPFYIHFNPLDLSHPEWRDNKISNPKKAMEFLESYRWSSHLDYLGIKNFLSVLNMDLLKEIFDGNNGYKKLMSNYLKDIQIDNEIILE